MSWGSRGLGFRAGGRFEGAPNPEYFQELGAEHLKGAWSNIPSPCLLENLHLFVEIVFFSALTHKKGQPRFQLHPGAAVGWAQGEGVRLSYGLGWIRFLNLKNVLKKGRE